MFEELKPHLIELRKRLVISVSAIFIFFCITFVFWKPLMIWMSAPLFEAMNIEQNTTIVEENNGFVDKVLSLASFEMPKELKDSNLMMTNDILEAVFMAFKITFFASLILSLPVIFWQFWLFIAPGLYDHEKKYVIPFVLFATAMFLLGCAFCYCIVFPMSFKFLIYFGEGIFVYVPKVSEYIDVFVKIMVAFGISFEFPVVSLFLAKIGFITDKTLKDFFRYAIVLIFIFAAVITPPDVVSQVMMAIPLTILYAISILIVKAVNPYKKEDDISAEEEDAKV